MDDTSDYGLFTTAVGRGTTTGRRLCNRQREAVGLQIAGARFDDLGVLKASRAFEQMRGEQRAWPEPPPLA